MKSSTVLTNFSNIDFEVTLRHSMFDLKKYCKIGMKNLNHMNKKSIY